MSEQKMVRCQVWEGPGFGKREIVGYTLYPENAGLPLKDLAGFDTDGCVMPKGESFLTAVPPKLFEWLQWLADDQQNK